MASSWWRPRRHLGQAEWWRRRPRRRHFRRPPEWRRKGEIVPGRPVTPIGWVPSPGGWTAPPGMRPGWNWTPPGGVQPRPKATPPWVCVWRAVPFISRYARSWMWWHGAWCVRSPAQVEPGGGDTTGVREPRQPVTPAGAGALSLPSEEESAKISSQQTGRDDRTHGARSNRP